MNVDERHEALIEYAEGTISGGRKEEVDALLANSYELRNELELLRSVFQELQNEDEGSVPEHYFTNFLPKIRKKLDAGAEYSYWSIPGFLQSFLQPALVVIIMVSLYGLYQTFNPDLSPSPIYALVNEFEQNEIMALVNESSSYASNNEVVFETKLPNELFGIYASNYQTENEMFSLLDEHEAEQVVERIQQTINQ